MSDYEWDVVWDSFVLHKDGEPTETSVSYCRGGWQMFDDGDLLCIDAHTPSEAMDAMNERKGIEAPYDARQGRLKIIENLKSIVDKLLTNAEHGVLLAREHITTLIETRNDVTFTVGYDAMQRELQTAYDIIHELKCHFDYLDRRIFDKRRWDGERERELKASR